jgi:hypothetical protein
VTTFPYGYAGSPQGMGTQFTILQYEQQRTIRQLNFEFWRRVKALMEFAASQGVPLGVGTGWRIQPSNPGPGFAQPGNSNHEGFPADGVSGGAVAADMVPSTSWGWMQSKLALYGLRSFQFVNNEPWHIQPVDIPAAREFRKVPWVLQAWPLPGLQPPSPPQPGPPPTEETDVALWVRFEGEAAEIAFDATGWRVITTQQRDQLRFAKLLRDGPATGYPTILPQSWKTSYPQLP